MKTLENLVGERYGSLVVIEDLGVCARKGRSHRRHYCKVLCDCGRESIKSTSEIRSGNTSSCGHCFGTSAKYGRKLFNCYHDMIARCYKPHIKNYRNYGLRGIGVCQEWRNNIDGYDNFCKWSLENGFAEKLSIDRIDNDGDYGPTNCRWTTRTIQNINKRSLKNTSGYIGISKHSSADVWYGRIKVDGKAVYTGMSKDIVEAVKMRDLYIVEHHLQNQLNGVM